MDKRGISDGKVVAEYAKFLRMEIRAGIIGSCDSEKYPGCGG
jgi:hypothetical protein